MKNSWIALIIILTITFFAFYPSLGNNFLNWDDYTYYLENPDIRVLDGPHIKNIFKHSILNVYVP